MSKVLLKVVMLEKKIIKIQYLLRHVMIEDQQIFLGKKMMKEQVEEKEEKEDEEEDEEEEEEE